MSPSESLKALRRVNPRSRPGFHETIEQHDELRTQIAATAYPAPRSSTARRLVQKRRLIGFSAAGALLSTAAVFAAVVVFTGSSAQSAYAAANAAVAATSAGALDSGTLVVELTHNGAVFQSDTTRWNDGNASLSMHGSPNYNEQLLLVGSDAYVLRAEGGRWTHYATDEGSPGPKIAAMRDLARADMSGTTVSDILAVTTGLEKTERADGSSIYRGTVKAGAPVEAMGRGSSAMRIISKLQKAGIDVTFELVVGSNGRVDEVSTSFRKEDGIWTSRTEYSRLGSTPAITAPDPVKVVEAEPVVLKPKDATPGQTITTG